MPRDQHTKTAFQIPFPSNKQQKQVRNRMHVQTYLTARSIARPFSSQRREQHTNKTKTDSNDQPKWTGRLAEEILYRTGIIGTECSHQAQSQRWSEILDIQRNVFSSVKRKKLFSDIFGKTELQWINCMQTESKKISIGFWLGCFVGEKIINCIK